MKKTRLSILAVLTALALLASACGGEDTSEADAAAAQAQAAADAAAAAQAAAEAELAAAQAAAAEAEAMAAEAAAEAEAELAAAQEELDSVRAAAEAGDEEAQAALAEAEQAAEEAAMAAEEATAAAEEASMEAMEAEEALMEAELTASTNLAQRGDPCIPPSTADQTARGTVVYAFGSIGNQNWLGPTAPFQSQATVMPMYEYLLCRDYQTGDVVQGTGQLAETWSHNDDFTQYTFNLRRGIQFHDGWGELTSADIKFSLELAVLDESVNPNKPDFSRIESIDTPDDYTVIVNLTEPNVQFPSILNEVIPAMPIVSKTYVEAVGREEASFRPIGTGPFEFHSHELDVHVAFEAVDNHWRVTPGIEIIEFRVVSEAATMAAMIDAGEAQMAPTTFDDIPRIDAEPDLKVVSLSGVRFPAVYLPGEYLEPTYDPENTPPWASDNEENNVKIRKALSLAIDRQEIIDFLFGGRGTTEGACVQSFWPAAPGYNQECEVDSYDPEAAKALLAEAGYPDPSQLVIPVDFAEHPQLTYTGAVMQAVAQQWQAALGVQIDSSQTDYRTYQALSGQAGAYSAFVYSAPFFDNPCTLLGYYTRTGDFFSYTGESEELNDLMNNCVAQVFPEDVAAAHGAVFDYIYDRTLGIPIGYVDSVLVFTSNLDWVGLPAPWNPYMTRFEYLRYTS